MNRLIALSIFAVLAASVQAQDGPRQAIEQRLDTYFEATKAKDWEQAVNLLYPKLFNLVPKEDMIQMFRDMEGNGIAFEMKTFELSQISDTIIYEGEAFALVNYTAMMSISFTSEAYKEASFAESIRQNYASSYGAENVVYHAENNSFDIRTEKALFAIAPLGSDAWAFMESEPGQKSLLSSMIPEAVQEKFLGKE